MRTFTALYDTRADAETAQTQLRELGVLEADRLGLHDGRTPARLGLDPWRASA
jgi:hypothetical protein